MVYLPQRKIDLSWSSNLAYAIGLLTADGCLNKDGRHLWFSSKDLEMITNLKKSLNLKNKIGKYARGGEKEKRYFCITFGDIYFYKFLITLGLSPAKSKTINSVNIPRDYFCDFLRGLFDGDGCFYSYWDKRWPNSFSFKYSIASASLNFIKWLREILTNYYGVKGYIHKGAGVYNLEYVKGDSRKLSEVMYYNKNILYLSRKYDKITSSLEQDDRFGLRFLQKQRKPR
ncbi:MAG: LAGLIDADG family homing endonuclease [bacterium]|nr:LAGLIDADG family homing endonuclease [bacterium]